MKKTALALALFIFTACAAHQYTLDENTPLAEGLELTLKYLDTVDAEEMRQADIIEPWYFISLLDGALDGDAENQLELGAYFYEIERFDLAYFWFLQSARQGNTESQVLVAMLYYNGTGVKKDESKTFQWASLAAVQGNESAYVLMASAYITGYAPGGENMIMGCAWAYLDSTSLIALSCDRHLTDVQMLRSLMISQDLVKMIVGNIRQKNPG